MKIVIQSEYSKKRKIYSLTLIQNLDLLVTLNIFVPLINWHFKDIKI